MSIENDEIRMLTQHHRIWCYERHFPHEISDSQMLKIFHFGLFECDLRNYFESSY